ncbi:MAG: hypothetical protein M1561_08245 [Gammaproteobacteria bacterium]|nr:hypothetical protein [Gammaproteobacteria bacterium]
MANLIVQKLRNFPSIYLTDSELAGVLNVSDTRRYSLVKHALKRGDLVKIRRGLYCLGVNLTTEKPHPLVLAQKILWPSYVSMESALAYHNLIPEAVYATTCVTPKRSRTFVTPYGNYYYHKIPSINFFLQVEKIIENKSEFLMATPWKAICDYVFCHKQSNINIELLLESLRIEQEDLPQISAADLMQLADFYQQKQMGRFINDIKKKFQL